MDRRRFLQIMAGVAALGMGKQPIRAVGIGSEESKFASSPPLWQRSDGVLLPPALRPGDTVGIVAPASGVYYSSIRSGVQKLRQLGLKVVLGKYIYPEHKYLAAPDQDRAQELMEFVEREDIRAIVAARGGYGVMRIFPYLDFALFRQHPKIIMGYSDITALLVAIYQQSRLVTFHGPVASSTFDAFTVRWLRTVLFAPDYASRYPEDWEPMTLTPKQEVWTIRSGQATGRLVGGNLTLLVSTLGTPYEVDTQDAILFLEEIAEEPYKLDRMLMQLQLAGKLQQCRGIALGQFVRCEATSQGLFPLSFTLREVLLQYFEPLDIPVVYGLPIGHIDSKWTLPLGTLARLDADAGTITLLEPVVTP